MTQVLKRGQKHWLMEYNYLKPAMCQKEQADRQAELEAWGRGHEASGVPYGRRAVQQKA